MMIKYESKYGLSISIEKAISGNVIKYIAYNI
jgi:hypothetical protein